MAYEEPGRRRYARRAVVAGLAAGTLCLATACGGAGSTPSAAAGRTATPDPAGSPSAGPARSPAVPSASPVTAGPASAAQIAGFTAAANGECGFTSSADKLTDARVTNNGWGSAEATADNPADQGNGSLIFRSGSAGWTYVECGSYFTGSGIPQDVLTALFGY